MQGDVRVAIADSYPIVLDGLEQLFRLEPGIEVVGRASTHEDVLRFVAESVADVFIVDPRMFDDPIGELVRISGGETRIVVFTSEVDEDEAIAMIRAGVRGVVLKHMRSEQLLSCVRRVAKGHIWIEKSSVARALEKMIRQEAQIQQVTDVLSRREIDVLRLAAQGMRNREIGNRLGLDEPTVKSLLHAVYEKLNLRTRIELTDFARTRGFVI